MPATYEPIATTTLGSAASTITFSSIPATYTDLKMVVVGTVNNATGTQSIVRFNSDTGTNYSYTRITGEGATATSTNGYSGPTSIALGNWYTFQSTPPSMFDIDIFSYAGSTFKTTLHTVTNDKNGSGYIEKQVSLWRSTSAINTILIAASGGNNFETGTTATLYGIKNA